MKYIRVQWKHANPQDPVTLYSEIDDDRWETRKVEVFADGSCGYAGPGESAGDSWLGIEPMPTLKEIASDPQFEPVEISQNEFERVWAQRRSA